MFLGLGVIGALGTDMPIDSSIYNALMAPRKSMMDYANEFEDRDAKREQRAMMRQQNALQLQSLKGGMEEKQRAASERNALAEFYREGVPDFSKPEMQAKLYQVAPSLADSVLKNHGELSQQAAKTAKENAEKLKADAETEQKTLATTYMRRDRHLQSLGGVQDLQTAAQWIQQGVQLGEFKPEQAQQIMGALQSGKMPLEQWKINAQKGGMTIQQQARDRMEQLEFGLSKEKAQEQARHNKASEGLTARGQNMSDARAREGLALQRERIASGTADNGKPLPTSALKMQQEALDAIGVSSSINADLGKLEQQIKDGKLSFGPVSNLANTGRNLAGMSNENSRNFATFRSNLERLRNESLRLNTGVQTDGDAQRAWNELFSSINDTDLVKQRLKEIQAINKRGVELQKLKVDSVRANYGKPPLETSGFESVPPALGDAARGAPASQAPASGLTVVRTGKDASGRKVQQMSDGSIRYAD